MKYLFLTLSVLIFTNSLNSVKALACDSAYEYCSDPETSPNTNPESAANRPSAGEGNLITGTPNTTAAADTTAPEQQVTITANNFEEKVAECSQSSEYGVNEQSCRQNLVERVNGLSQHVQNCIKEDATKSIATCKQEEANITAMGGNAGAAEKANTPAAAAVVATGAGLNAKALNAPVKTEEKSLFQKVKDDAPWKYEQRALFTSGPDSVRVTCNDASQRCVVNGNSDDWRMMEKAENEAAKLQAAYLKNNSNAATAQIAASGATTTPNNAGTKSEESWWDKIFSSKHNPANYKTVKEFPQDGPGNPIRVTEYQGNYFVNGDTTNSSIQGLGGAAYQNAKDYADKMNAKSELARNSNTSTQRLAAERTNTTPTSTQASATSYSPTADELRASANAIRESDAIIMAATDNRNQEQLLAALGDAQRRHDVKAETSIMNSIRLYHPELAEKMRRNAIR